MALTDKLTAIANAIRSKTGGTSQLTLTQMATEIGNISDIGSLVTFSAVNTDASGFLSQPAYSSSDYTYTNVPSSFSTSRPDRPNSTSLTLPANTAEIIFVNEDGDSYASAASQGAYTVENLVPDKKYFYLATDSSGGVLKAGIYKAEGALRDINGGGGTFNIRDLGGWACDGGTIKYGKIFRGCELNGDNYHITLSNAQIKMFKELLGIRDEIDLRGNSEVDGDDDVYGTMDDITSSALGGAVDYARYPVAAYANGVDLTNSTQTGYYGAILKRAAENAVKNRPCYIHCMAGADRTGTVCALIEALCGVSQSDIDRDYELTSFSSGNTRLRTSSEWTGLINRINSFSGSTFRDKVVNYAILAGVTIDEINALRAALIDGAPETLINNTTFSVTANTDAHTSISNSSSSVAAGSSYTANVTVDTNYSASVTVTMGSTDITSSAYSNGVISIASVTGNIVINVTSFFSGNYVSSVGYTDDTRWSGSDGTARQASGFTAVNEISLSGDYPKTFKLSGINWRYNSSCVIVFYKNNTYNTSKVLNAEWSSSSINGSLVFDTNDSNAVILTLSGDMNFSGFKVCGYGLGANAVIIQEINAQSSKPAADEEFSVTNILTTAVDTDNSPYNSGTGYKTGYRLGSSGAESAFADYCVTGYIPVSNGDVIRVLNVGEVTGYSIYMFGYDANFAVYGANLCALNPVTSGHGNGLLSAKITSSSVKYIRFAFNTAKKDDVIVTKNEKISPLEV